jgi:uncharacterized membrane protein YhaH (DUF805 family)
MMPETTFSYPSDAPTFQQRLSEFFSFEGRLGRQQYWLRTLILWVVNLAIMIPLTIGQSQDGAAAAILLAIGFAVYGVAMWASLATVAKRLHDRGRSAWFMLISLVPLVGLWLVVEVCFLRGEETPNEYGDPVA